MTKYRVLKTIPNTDLVEGKEVEMSMALDISYQKVHSNGITATTYRSTIEAPFIYLFIQAGFLEEIKEPEVWDARKLRNGDRYYYLTSWGIPEFNVWNGCASDLFRLATGNVFQTEEASIAYKTKMLEAVKGDAATSNTGFSESNGDEMMRRDRGGGGGNGYEMFGTSAAGGDKGKRV